MSSLDRDSIAPGLNPSFVDGYLNDDLDPYVEQKIRLAEKGHPQFLDTIYSEANRGFAMAQEILGQIARSEVVEWGGELTEREDEPELFTVASVEQIWDGIDQTTASHLRTQGDHQTAAFIES